MPKSIKLWYLKYVQFAIGQLHLNKAAKGKGRRKEQKEKKNKSIEGPISRIQRADEKDKKKIKEHSLELKNTKSRLSQPSTDQNEFNFLKNLYITMKAYTTKDKDFFRKKNRSTTKE